jgi:hypothetical protein
MPRRVAQKTVVEKEFERVLDHKTNILYLFWIKDPSRKEIGVDESVDKRKAAQRAALKY